MRICHMFVSFFTTLLFVFFSVKGMQKQNAIKEEKAKPMPKLYNLEPENCYTVGEICKKYRINDSTVWSHVRKYSIPTRQIGNYVYVPKEEIDNLYKSDVL